MSNLGKLNSAIEDAELINQLSFINNQLVGPQRAQGTQRKDWHEKDQTRIHTEFLDTDSHGWTLTFFSHRGLRGHREFLASLVFLAEHFLEASFCESSALVRRVPNGMGPLYEAV